MSAAPEAAWAAAGTHDVRTLMLDFQVPRISTESVDDNRGSFTIEPLDRGFGYTFGNSLRRGLLSSLSRAAVASLPVEGGARRISAHRGVNEEGADIVPHPQCGGCPTDYDKLTLDIETDGSIDPHAALREAAEILISQLAIFTDADRVVELREAGIPGPLEPGQPGAPGGAPARQPNALDDILIEELEL